MQDEPGQPTTVYAADLLAVMSGVSGDTLQPIMRIDLVSEKSGRTEVSVQGAFTDIRELGRRIVELGERGEHEHAQVAK